jgi:predicted 3-demethylubiquinone-9 3-methyltransferase (glyoxalase superfamily)
MTVDELIEAITDEMERVWGETGFDGTESQYAWLLERYGITEGEDARWIVILRNEDDELDDEDRAVEGLMEFLGDEAAVTGFLEGLLEKYRSSTATYKAKR